MKKSIVLILLSFVTITINARVNWVIRAGLGATHYAESHTNFNMEGRITPTLSAGIESSITLGKGSSWVFSPSLNTNLSLKEEGTSQVYLSTLFGSRIRIGQGSSFVPKFGFAYGCTIAKTLKSWDSNSTRKIHPDPMIGPEIAFAFERKRFVLCASAFYSLMQQNYSYDFRHDSEDLYHADLTIGYKF